MSIPRGVLYYGGGDISGYGQSAIANVRALVNAGIPLQWIPLEWGRESMLVSSWVLPDGRVKPLLNQRGASGNLADLLHLIERTSARVDYDTVVAHASPEFWPRAFESGKRNIGCTAWETDRAPAHWLPLMRRADCVVVPCAQNRDAFRRSGLRVPIAVVPHIRRHRWLEFAPSELAQTRDDLGIPAGNRVFYSINAWDPRKALPALIRAFASAFTADDAVTLLIKTGATGHEEGPFYAVRSTRELATRAITAAAAEFGRAPPYVVLHNEEVDGDAIDMIHAVGDVYVSLTHGEGWGLGAFEAATLGKPVVMTGWGGHTEFLGANWSGAVKYRLAPVPLWPPYLPSYFPSQRWAEPILADAARIMRAVFDDPAPAQVEAMDIRERVFQQFSEPALTGKWLEALGG